MRELENRLEFRGKVAFDVFPGMNPIFICKLNPCYKIYTFANKSRQVKEHGVPILFLHHTFRLLQWFMEALFILHVQNQLNR